MNTAELLVGRASKRNVHAAGASGDRVHRTSGSREAFLDLSSDGKRLLMTHSDGKGAIWEVDPALWAERACRLANRTLTRAEWDEFLRGRPYEPACRSR